MTHRTYAREWWRRNGRRWFRGRGAPGNKRILGVGVRVNVLDTFLRGRTLEVRRKKCRERQHHPVTRKISQT